MQQLTLQFEGYADSRQPEAQGTAKVCQRGVFYKAFQHFLDRLQKSVARPSRKISVGMCSLRDLLQATLAVCFGFGVMFLAALIGG